MTTVRDVLQALETIAPQNLAFSFDKVGLQVGNPNSPVSKAVVALDRSLGAINFAKEVKAELLITHHPLIFDPLERVVESDEVGFAITEMIKSGIAFVAAHTNWDCAVGGINDVLAERLELQEIMPFGFAPTAERLKLVVFAPEENADQLVDCLSAVGAGVIGNYTRCAFMSEGTGTYVGNESSNPTIGERGRVESAIEVRIEMVLDSTIRTEVEEVIRAVHPYDEPAFDIYNLSPTGLMNCGRIGHLANHMSLRNFAEHVDRRLETRCQTWGDPDKQIEFVAVVGGAADGDWAAAMAEGADVYVTGEVKQHTALAASSAGIGMIAAGHYATENPGAAELAARLSIAIPAIDWMAYSPPPGFNGRPF